MNKNEYVDTLVFGDVMVNVGQDDYGQCYFLEWAKNGELNQECCGTYNFHYKEYAEYKFGDPERDCPYYESNLIKDNLENCSNNFKYGYCDKCKYQDVKYFAFQHLVDLDIIDRRGNINEAYQNIIVKKEDIKDGE